MENLEDKSQAGSLFQRTAAQRDERKQGLSVELPVPTWEINGVKTLFWSFKVLPKKVLQKFSDKKRTLEGDVDVLIEAHNGFFLYDPGKVLGNKRLWPDPRTDQDREEYGLIENEDGHATRVDSYLADAVGFKIDPTSPMPETTQVVMYLFKDNETAIANITARVVAWCQNTDLDVNKLMLGES